MNRFLYITALAICTVLGTGCSSADDTNPPMLADSGTKPMATPTTPEVCANHEQGCPCDQPGETTDCGRIKRVADDYVWCSTGIQTCDQYGSWGACVGDQVADTTQQAQ
jgi:hypothetical protein